jgi:formate hydrogenlyase subunit 6/NADH:ubiquinone oxidoreductase subunit I
METAYRLKIVQDVYNLDDDTVTGFHRREGACGECTKCEDYCPTHLKAEEIGVKQGPDDCIMCLYCWWVCPNDAIELHGELNHLERQVERYKGMVEAF